MYFGNFNPIAYEGINVTDITTRVAFLDTIKKNNFLTFEYQVGDGESPEAIAYNFYGDASLHWIVLLLNDIYDPIYGWHLAYEEILAYMVDKYGDLDEVGGGYGGIHHWEFDGMWLDEVNQVSSVASITSGGTGYEVGDRVYSVEDSITHADFEVTSVSGGVVTGLTVVDGGVFLTSADTAFTPLGGHGTGLSIEVAYSVPTGAVAVSNRQYEEGLNEEKRRIKVLYSTHVTQIIQELQYLVNDGKR